MCKISDNWNIIHIGVTIKTISLITNVLTYLSYYVIMTVQYTYSKFTRFIIARLIFKIIIYYLAILCNYNLLKWPSWVLTWSNIESHISWKFSWFLTYEEWSLLKVQKYLPNRVALSGFAAVFTNFKYCILLLDSSLWLTVPIFL